MKKQRVRHGRIITAFLLIAILMLLGCNGFEGVFTDKASAAFKSGGSINLPKAGGGSVIGIFIDVNNDGVLDGVDLNNDGIPELLFKDLQVGQSAGLDLNGDGTIDYYLSVDYQGNFFLNTQRPSGNVTSGNVTVTVGPNGVPTGLNTSGGTGVDDATLGQIYADVTPPTAGTNNAGGTYVGAQVVTLTCSDNVACNSIAYTTDGSTPSFVSGAGSTIIMANSTQLTIGATATLRWIVRDSNGNVSGVQSASFTITGDITAPAPGNSGTITTASITAVSLTLNWTQATDAITPQGSLQYLAYRSTANNLGSVANIEGNGTALGSYSAGIASVNVMGLSPSTTYYFNIIVRDNAGNKAAYTTVSASTTADTTAPTPGNSGTITTTTVTETSLTLNWTQATDNVTAQGSLQYLAYRSTSNNLASVANIEANGTAIGSYTAGIATVNVTGLTASTSYYFNIIARDAAGNKAAYNVVNVTTEGTWYTFLGSSNTEELYTAASTGDGGAIIAGIASANIATLGGQTPLNAYTVGQDILVIKLSAAGAVQWYTFLGGSSADTARSIAQTNDGGYIIGGYTSANISNLGGQTPLNAYSSNSDLLIIKLSAAGAVTWYTFLGGAGNDNDTSVAQTSDGGYVVSGGSGANIASLGGQTPINPYSAAFDAIVIKLNAAGSVSWYTFLGGTGAQSAISIAQASDDGYIVAGESAANIASLGGQTPLNAFTSNNNWFITKLTSGGAVSWYTFLGGAVNNKPYATLQTNDGGYVVAGRVSANIASLGGQTPLNAFSSSFDGMVVKLNAAGSVSWYTFLGGSGSDEIFSIKQTSDNGFILAGYSTANIASLGGQTPLMPFSSGNTGTAIKLTNAGAVSWYTFLGNSSNGSSGSIFQKIGRAHV